MSLASYSGQYLFIPYDWGNYLQTPGTLWREAFEIGLSTWDGAGTMVLYYYYSGSENTINIYYDETALNRGITYIHCLGKTTVQVEVEGNGYWDLQDGYSDVQRRGIATHELGHGMSIGHIPNWYSHVSLMYKSTPLEFFTTIFIPQLSDIILVGQIYP
jgi:hypothetical protein